jgi:putative ABC transport system permease protein
VAVIGTDIQDALFPFVDPLDKEMSIDGARFRVIGVLRRKGKFLGQSRDIMILVPTGSLQKKDPRFNFIVADVKPVSADRMEAAQEQVREALRRQRKLRFWEKDTFSIFTQDTLTGLYTQITGGIYMVMIAISSIGLVVGGVGVMNIMLVSVTERTREIGVRKAIGARRSDITWQFLLEAMTLTGAGGILGIIFGCTLSLLIRTLVPELPSTVPNWSIVAGFVVAVSIGLFFGMWPAVKASRLDPIVALHHE